MTAYLDIAGFKLHSVMPAEFVDALQTVAPNWLDTQLDYWSRQIDARLRKRYTVPFESPFPNSVQGWLARIVTVRAFLKRGVNPNDPLFEEIKTDADTAWEEIKEAADSNEGLFDLPPRSDTSASGISRGNTFAFTEASPYVWTDEQARVGRSEDSVGRGTGG